MFKLLFDCNFKLTTGLVFAAICHVFIYRYCCILLQTFNTAICCQNKRRSSSIKDIYEKNSFLEITQKVKQLVHIYVLKLDRKSHILLRMNY